MKWIFDELLKRYPALVSCAPEIMLAFETMKKTFSCGGKLLVCGSGGSAADSEHIVGELMKGFLLERRLTELQCEAYGEMANGLQRALPAISLVSQSSLMTAYSNDVAPDMVFAQQVFAYSSGSTDDAVLALSTSGNSRCVVNAVKIANAMGVASIGITGSGGGELARLCKVCISLPEKETFKVQELTLPVYHALCAMLEQEFFG